MSGRFFCALLVVALAFAGPAEARKDKEPSIVGLWSKIELAVANSTALGFDEALAADSYSYAIFSATSNPKVTTIVWIHLVPSANISQASRDNGPTYWDPIDGANAGAFGMGVKTGPYKYDIIMASPFFSVSGVMSGDGKHITLYPLGQGGSAGQAFPGLHRVKSGTFPSKTP